MATTYESFKEAWLSEILQDNPNSVQKGRRFARKLVSHGSTSMKIMTRSFFAMAQVMGELMLLIFSEAIWRKKMVPMGIPGF